MQFWSIVWTGENGGGFDPSIFFLEQNRPSGPRICSSNPNSQPFKLSDQTSGTLFFNYIFHLNFTLPNSPSCTLCFLALRIPEWHSCLMMTSVKCSWGFCGCKATCIEGPEQPAGRAPSALLKLSYSCGAKSFCIHDKSDFASIARERLTKSLQFVEKDLMKSACNAKLVLTQNFILICRLTRIFVHLVSSWTAI